MFTQLSHEVRWYNTVVNYIKENNMADKQPGPTKKLNLAKLRTDAHNDYMQDKWKKEKRMRVDKLKCNCIRTSMHR